MDELNITTNKYEVNLKLVSNKNVLKKKAIYIS